MPTKSPPPNPLRALLLDLDGTLCDTHGLIQRSLDHAMQTHLGQPSRFEIWQANVGLPLESAVRANAAHYGVDLNEADLPTIFETYRDYMKANADDVRAFPGVREMLEAFRNRGVRLAMVTTKRHPMAARHLETSGLTAFFETVVAWEDTDAHKPDPAPFRFALSQLGIGPNEAAHVGDSAADIEGARAAGVFAVAACWGTDNRPALLATVPDALAERPSDLLSLF